jgi:methylmalonyl-CoA/ethylmalonyl-CoA epimerase
MQEPGFNETVQLGIVVRDLEATVRRYEDDYGIGPWQVARIDLGDANDYREYGETVERSNRIAVATVGQVMWELIEPLDEDGIYARFSRREGRGRTPRRRRHPGLRRDRRAGGAQGRLDAQL